MSDDELTMRLRRIYAAIAASEELNLSAVPPEVISAPNFICITQDFRGGLSEEQISNLAHQLIHTVANLRDNLKNWASANGRDPQRVRETFGNSRAAKIIQDLSNNDKHGYPPRDGRGNSEVAPKLVDIDRSMRITANPGNSFAVFFGPSGPQTSGGGSAKVIVTGQVIDKDGKAIGDLYELALSAVDAWEALLKEYAVAAA
jgi:hypothetical protein